MLPASAPTSPRRRAAQSIHAALAAVFVVAVLAGTYLWGGSGAGGHGPTVTSSPVGRQPRPALVPLRPTIYVVATVPEDAAGASAAGEPWVFSSSNTVVVWAASDADAAAISDFVADANAKHAMMAVRPIRLVDLGES